MRKLTGLLAFAVALAGAVVLTTYYTSRPAPPPPPSAPAPAVPTATAADTHANVPIVFKPQLLTLDFAARKGHVTLDLERDPARPAPEKVWVWTYFFTPEAQRRYCAGEPVEVRQPFATGNRSTVTVDASVNDCPAPRTPSSTYYARVNVSTESAFAARLAEQRISYDLSTASPVVVQGVQPKKH
jgi:hypothetical protein